MGKRGESKIQRDIEEFIFYAKLIKVLVNS